MSSPESLLESGLVRALLRPASIFYGFGTTLRYKAFVSGILARKQVQKPVVSVGNLTVGGTGKTPIVIDLSRRLIATGKRVGVLSRGYKRESTESYVVVSSGSASGENQEEHVTCRQAGDEPYLISRVVDGAVVISGASRSDTAKIAVEQFDCDVLILDDGFQHVRLRRDLDIVLIDYADDLESELVLPAGRLREPLSGLARAGLVVITKVPESGFEERLRELSSMVRRYNVDCEIASCRFVPSGLRKVLSPDGVWQESHVLSGARVLAVAGIARPEKFFKSLTDLGALVADTISFPDHHWFSTMDLTTILRQAERHKVEYVIATEKDLARLESLVPLVPELEQYLWALSLETEWIDQPPSFVTDDRII